MLGGKLMATFIANLGISAGICRALVVPTIEDGSEFPLTIEGRVQYLRVSSTRSARNELTVQCENNDCFVTLHLSDRPSDAAQATILYKRKE